MSHYTNRILILFAHPALQKSRVNRRLIEKAHNLEGVTFHDLYEVYPDFHIRVKREQSLLLDHDLIVFHHPFYWYSSPAIIKEWIDLVLEYGFAYGIEGTALKGKSMMTAISAGGSEDSYKADGVHYYHVRDFLRTFERTAALCNMTYLPPFVVHHNSELATSEDIAVYGDLYRKVIVMLRDNEINFDAISNFKYINDYILDQYESWSV